MNSEEIIEKRYRNFIILLYPDDENFFQVLQDLKGSFKRYAYIKHIPETEEKKEHIHFILSLDNPRSVSSLSKRLEIKERFIQPIKSLRASCRYLIHKDNEDKYQYDLSQVFCSEPFRSTFYKCFDDLLSDEQILQNIYDFCLSIKHLPGYQIEMKLSLFVCENAWERVYKRYYATISKFIVAISNN